MRVEMNWYAELLLQCANQLLCGERLADASHVFDRKQVGAGFFKFLGQIDVILQVELGSGRIENVTAVADSCFTKRAVRPYGINGQFQIRHPIQRIEYAE